MDTISNNARLYMDFVETVFRILLSRGKTNKFGEIRDYQYQKLLKNFSQYDFNESCIHFIRGGEHWVGFNEIFKLLVNRPKMTASINEITTMLRNFNGIGKLRHYLNYEIPSHYFHESNEYDTFYHNGQLYVTLSNQQQRRMSNAYINTRKGYHPLDLEFIDEISRFNDAIDIIKNESVIAVDFEGIKLGQPDGKLCLVQIACLSNNQCFAFDCINFICPKHLFEELHFIFESPNIKKLFFDLTAEVRTLYEITSGYTKFQNVLDIQLYGYDTLSLLNFANKYYPNPLNYLVKQYAPHKYFFTIWEERPLSLYEKLYAGYDVWILTALFDKLFAPSKKRTNYLSYLSEEKASNLINKMMYH